MVGWLVRKGQALLSVAKYHHQAVVLVDVGVIDIQPSQFVDFLGRQTAATASKHGRSHGSLN